MIRRSFLITGLTVLLPGRRVWEQPASSSTRYSPLTVPVRIPIEAVRTPWQPESFKAEAVAPPARRVLISGVLFRRPAADRAELCALCLTCTHEQCQVDFIAQPTTLPRTDRTITQPVFLCACHSSIFDAVDDGAWIAGPAPRGLYRFRLHQDADAVVIDEVEEDALSAV
jgi:Rieske Fe-S protein